MRYLLCIAGLAVAGLAGLLLALAQTVIHEVLAATLFIAGAVLFASGCVCSAIIEAGLRLEKHLYSVRKALPAPDPTTAAPDEAWPTSNGFCTCRCSACGQEISAPSAYRGREVSCRHCKTRQTFPL